MGSFFIGGCGGGGSSSVDWNDITNKPALDPEGLVQTFLFSDTSPKLIGVVPKDTIVGEVVIELEQDFDDIGTTITVGDTLSINRLMKSDENDPTNIAKYSANVGYKYSSNTNIYLYVSGTNTQGQLTAKVYFE
jgi:hypothetical protein